MNSKLFLKSRGAVALTFYGIATVVLILSCPIALKLFGASTANTRELSMLGSMVFALIGIIGLLFDKGLRE